MTPFPAVLPGDRLIQKRVIPPRVKIIPKVIEFIDIILLSVDIAQLWDRLFRGPSRIPQKTRPERLEKLILLIRVQFVRHIVRHRRDHGVDTIIGAPLVRLPENFESFRDAGKIVLRLIENLNSLLQEGQNLNSLLFDQSIDRSTKESPFQTSAIKSINQSINHTNTYQTTRLCSTKMCFRETCKQVDSGKKCFCYLLKIFLQEIETRCKGIK